MLSPTDIHAPSSEDSMVQLVDRFHIEQNPQGRSAPRRCYKDVTVQNYGPAGTAFRSHRSGWVAVSREENWMEYEPARIMRWRELADQYRLKAACALNSGTRLAFHALAGC